MRRLGGVALLLVAALVLGSPAARAADKSYTFPRVTIDATVLPDGSLKLVEHRTFDFHGSFTYAYYDIDWPYPRIEDFRILENGTPLVAVATNPVDDTFHAVWAYEAQDEMRTFTISYRARCAVDVFADTAHLLWQFIGTGWSVPTDHARITVHLPGRASRVARPSVPCPSGKNDIDFRTTPLRPHDVRAWGHGPLNGSVRIVDPQTVVFDVRDVPPSSFVEGSITFPPRSVPQAYLHHEKRLPAILANERRLVDEANARRNRHRLERTLTFVLFGAVPGLFLLLLLLSFWRDRVPGVPRILQEPPEEIHPVALAYDWAAYSGRFSPKNAYRAQLLHLASEHDIEITAVGQVSKPEDFTLRRLKEPEDELDADFVKFLFMDDRKELKSLDTLRAEGKRRSQLLKWTKDATEKSKGTVDRIRKGRGRLEGHLTAVVGIGGAVAGRYLGHDLAGGIAFWLIPISLVGCFVTARLMHPHPKELETRTRIARWKAFRRFLKKFSSLPNAPALAVIIWENYMVEAVALGVAKRVQKQVRGLVAEEELPSPWAGAPPGMGGYRWLNTFQSTPVAHAVAVVASSGSTSGGWGSSSSGGGFSGGGFSGGGGGGGGGTGGGAG